MRSLALVLAPFVLSLVPLAAAHGAVEAKEVETLVLTDFGDDSVYELGGYDLYQIYVGEAYFADLGDGVYFHTLLFGNFADRPMGQDEFRVTVTLTAGNSSVARSFWTTDGQTFETDFDLLEAAPQADEVEIQRAFISFASSGLKPGDPFTSVKVESFVDGDIRDAAPGGRYVPGTGGQVEIPEDNPDPTPYTLTGPTKYVAVTTTPIADGARLNIQSLLKEGGQHVHVILPTATNTWQAEARLVGGPDLPKATSKVADLVLVPIPDGTGMVHPLAFNVTTDIGGRVGLVAAIVDGAVVVLPEGSPVAPAAWNAAEPAESPFAGALVVMAVGLAAALCRTRRN